MVSALSAHWPIMEPVMLGLKRGGLMNQCLEDEETYRQGRHHVMAALNQILEWSIAVEQVSACLEAANLTYSLVPLHAATYVVPITAAYLSSRQIKWMNIGTGANYIQDHLGKLSLAVATLATATLFFLGQQLLGAVALAYLTVGALDRLNLFTEGTQNRLRQMNFMVGNLAGLYFGGNFIRAMCVTNLAIAAVQNYFKYLQESAQANESKADVQKAAEMAADILDDDAPQDLSVDHSHQISVDELSKLTDDTQCSVDHSHIKKRALPSVDPSVTMDEILELGDKINWDDHEYVIKNRLAKDKRWLEVGQFQSLSPIEYFKRNLTTLVEQIRDRKILQGKPQNYEMLDYYCRYIAQELKKQDEMTQADKLIKLGIDGGEYCGTGKFGTVEEVFEDLISQSAGLPLDMRIFGALRQERTQVWQNIYLLTWKTNPFWQIQGYFTDVTAVHNANLFMNLIKAGDRFGIPQEAAANDQTAVINPATHYLAFSIVNWVEKSFWNGRQIPQCYLSVDRPEGNERLKPWKWVKLTIDSVTPRCYDQDAILNRLQATIGTAQIGKGDIYTWWLDWIGRQDHLTEGQRNGLADELMMSASINGEAIEERGKIRNKFLIAMLIEMGVLEKPSDWIEEDKEQKYLELGSE